MAPGSAFAGGLETTEMKMNKASEHPAGRLATGGRPELDKPPTSGTPVFDPIHLGKQLALLPPSLWPWEEPEEIRVELLPAIRDDHRVFEIILYSRGEIHRLIGKVYFQDRQDVCELMDEIRRVGFGSDVEFSIPRPVGYLQALRLLLQEKVEGIPAKYFFKLGDERQRTRAAELCARWLARFHASAPPIGKVLTTDKFLARCCRKCALIVGKGGLLATQAKRLFEGLEEARLTLGEAPLCAGHGDFGTYQIILGERRTAVFDWDLYDIADPARDAARFVVSLERQALRRYGSLRALDGTSEVFLKTYLSGNEKPQIWRRLPFYKAAFCLRGASFDLHNRPQPRPDWAEAMLDAGLEELEKATYDSLAQTG